MISCRTAILWSSCGEKKNQFSIQFVYRLISNSLSHYLKIISRCDDAWAQISEKFAFLNCWKSLGFLFEKEPLLKNFYKGKKTSIYQFWANDFYIKYTLTLFTINLSSRTYWTQDWTNCTTYSIHVSIQDSS